MINNSTPNCLITTVNYVVLSLSGLTILDLAFPFF